MSTNGEDQEDIPIRRYKSRGNRQSIGIALGVGVGAAIGVATGQLAVWVTVGAGLGLLLGAFLQRRARSSR